MKKDTFLQKMFLSPCLLILLLSVVGMSSVKAQTYTFSPALKTYTDCGSGTIEKEALNYSGCYLAGGTDTYQLGQVHAAAWSVTSWGTIYFRVQKCSGYFQNGNSGKVLIKNGWDGGVECSPFTISDSQTDYVTASIGWSVYGNSYVDVFLITSDQTYKFYAGRITITANYEISASASPSYGGSVSGDGSYAYNSYCTLSASAYAGYNFARWKKDGSTVSTSSNYRFKVTSDGTYVADFEAETYTISASASPSAGGSVSGAGEYNYGSTCTLTATPNTGYSFVRWTKNGSQVSTNASYSFSVSESASYVAVFSKNSYTISASASPSAGGSVTGAGTYNHGTTCTLTATASTGYTFVRWTKNGSQVSSSATYSFTVTENATYVAVFNKNSYTISASANPSSGGSVSGAGTYSHGDNCTLVASPNSDYNFVRWTKNGSQVSTNATYSFTVTANASYVAVFSKKTYTISASASPSEGGSVSGAGTYDHGSSCSLTATPATGYSFVRWTKNGSQVSTSATYSFTVTENSSFVAVFEENGPTNHWTAEESQFEDNMALTGVIQINGVEQYSDALEVGAFCGSQCRGSAIAIPFSTTQRYLVVLTIFGVNGDQITFKLYDHDQGVELDLQSPAAVTFGSNSLGAPLDPYVLNFTDAVVTYTISASASPSAGGTVSGAGTYDQGSNCTLTATANTGYSFVRWTKNGSQVSTSASYTFTVTENASYVAVFSQNTYTISASANPSAGGTVSGGGSYNYGSACTLTATPASGYTFTNWTENGSEVSANASYGFTVTGNRTLVANFAAAQQQYHWTPNTSQYANTMTAIGVIQIDGVEQRTTTLELGAFCNNECRGTKMLVYYSQVDRYLLFLDIFGNDGDVLTFRLYDHSAGQEVNMSCSATETFVSNGTLGVAASPYVFNFTNVHSQTTSLPEGWSWWSPAVEVDGAEGLAQMEESLGENGIMIKSRLNGFVTNYGGMWMGSLESISSEQTYLIQTSAACEMTLTGSAPSPSSHAISLAPGWSWIGYPLDESMDVATALSGLAPTDNDMLKSRDNGFTIYYAGFGWMGSLNTLQPGMGLMYESHNNQTVTLTYPGSGKSDNLKKNASTHDNHWKPTSQPYPDNMTLMAVVEADDMELRSEQYELGVFAGDECRGSASLKYEPGLGRYVAYLTVYGEDPTPLRFGLYDIETSEERYDAETELVYVSNVSLGVPTTLYVVRFRGATGLHDLGIRANLFPNPVDRGQTLLVSLEEAKERPIRVEIVNELGAVVSSMTSAEEPVRINAPEDAGVYLLRISVEGKGSCHRKLVVR